MKRIADFILKILGLPFTKGEMGGRGQVAIFAALIFQVLFVFFAMVVNVGLLVHHKINLQNSVDLAAYYGAMKQAEVLNAIAHVNYQIRQSWKLMVFRYRGIGMAGNNASDSPWNPYNETLGSNANSDTPYSCPASFCINYPQWMIMNTNEDYCRDMCNGMSITLPGQPFGSSLLAGLLSAALPGITAAVDSLSNQARTQVRMECKKKSAYSWFVLGRYIFGFKNDVANRKRVLNKLANSLSYDTSDFLDIDGEKVREGVRKTLHKNLTYQNQASIPEKDGTGGDGTFDFFNSLAAGGCGGSKDDEGTPPKWLSEIFVKPLYGFLDGECTTSDSQVNFKIKILNAIGNANLPNYVDQLDQNVVNFILAYAADPLNFDTAESRLFHTTVGYEKNPWCMAYVRVKASTKPKIPFSPFSGIELKATAYAKPFGGRIGPWFYKTWPSSADSSTGNTGDQVDGILPPRVRPGEQNVDPNNDYLRVDHSRYVGDRVGVKSTMTMGHYAQAFVRKHSAKGGNRLNLLWWSHLMDGTADINTPTSHGDVLAWDTDNNVAPGVRTVEVGAIIPDQFDIANYSIEPNWWREYAQRIQKRNDFQSLHVRGDLGYRKGAPGPWATMSVKDQMALALPDNALQYNEALTYYAGRNQDPAKAFTEVLTGWHNKGPGNYDLDSGRFGKCYEGAIVQGTPDEIEKGTPGNCIAGGRVGYSVKIIDEQHLIDTQEIGGQGTTGRIKNLPPGL
jgi:hypothetical protein